MRRTWRLDLFSLDNGIGDKLLYRNCIVGQLIDERRVGSVFKQTAHQVGQQRFMHTHWRINTTWSIQFAVRNRSDYGFVHGFAHAVETLEFVLTGIITAPSQVV